MTWQVYVGQRSHYFANRVGIYYYKSVKQLELVNRDESKCGYQVTTYTVILSEQLELAVACSDLSYIEETGPVLDSPSFFLIP